MEPPTPRAKLEVLIIDANTVIEHAERLQNQAEADGSTLSESFRHQLDVLTEELRGLRDDIANLQNSSEPASDSTS